MTITILYVQTTRLNGLVKLVGRPIGSLPELVELEGQREQVVDIVRVVWRRARRRARQLGALRVDLHLIAVGLGRLVGSSRALLLLSLSRGLLLLVRGDQRVDGERQRLLGAGFAAGLFSLNLMICVGQERWMDGGLGLCGLDSRSIAGKRS